MKLLFILLKETFRAVVAFKAIKGHICVQFKDGVLMNDNHND